MVIYSYALCMEEEQDLVQGCFCFKWMNRVSPCTWWEYETLKAGVFNRHLAYIDQIRLQYPSSLQFWMHFFLLLLRSPQVFVQDENDSNNRIWTLHLSLSVSLVIRLMLQMLQLFLDFHFHNDGKQIYASIIDLCCHMKDSI